MASSRSGPAGLEALLDTLRRAPGHATRKPRAAVQAAVRQLLVRASQPAAPRGDGHERRQYRVDDLARAAGTTTRNVRAYQERGLLHPPRRVGRTAVFDDSHLARLKLITSMLDRGYTGAHIAELLGAWREGRDLADVLGLERLVRPWAADEPTTMPLREVHDLVGDGASLDRLVQAKLVEPRATDAVVQRPQLLRAFAEMRGHGMPMSVVLDLHERIAGQLDDVSRVLVAAGARQVADQLPAAGELDEQDVTALVETMLRFRTLALDSATATLAHAIEQRIEALLGDYLAGLAGIAEPGDGSDEAVTG